MTRLVVSLASVLVSCSSPDFRPPSDVDSQLPTEALRPVDCTTLCPAPDELAAEAEQSDSVRLRGDLPVGTGQVLLGWDDGSGTERWLLPAPTTEASMIFGDGVDTQPVWNVRIAIPCFPESAVNVQMTREGDKSPLMPGTYPLVGVSFDVPGQEQRTDIDSMQVSGEVVITRAASDLVSGYMRGWGSGNIASSSTLEDLGVRYEVAAMQFEQIPGDFVGKP
jgi:hypothetical protein